MTPARVRARVVGGAIATAIASTLAALVFLPACGICPSCDEECGDCDPTTRYCLRLRDYQSQGHRHAYCVYLPEACSASPTCDCLLASEPYKDLEELLAIAPESETCAGDTTNGFEILGCTTSAVCPEGCEEKNACPAYCCHLD